MLDIHGIIRIDASACNAEVRHVLETAYADFVTSTPQADPDIIVTPLQHDADLERIMAGRKNLVPVEYMHNGTLQVLHFHKGKIESRMVTGTPVRLQCLQGRHFKPSRLLARINDCVQLALENKGGSLIKAAALARGGHNIVMIGGSGAGKTSLLLPMMNRGWEYLSDNTCLLYKGRCHLFKRKMVFHAHHLDALPGVFQDNPKFVRIRKYRWVRSMLKKVLSRTLPENILRFEKLKRVYDPYVTADPLDVFPHANILPGFRPTGWIMLERGDRFAMNPLDREEFVRKMLAIIYLARPGWNEMHNWRTLLEDGYRPQLYTILQRSVTGPCFTVTIPREMGPETAAKALEAALDHEAGRRTG